MRKSDVHHTFVLCAYKSFTRAHMQFQCYVRLESDGNNILQSHMFLHDAMLLYETSQLVFSSNPIYPSTPAATGTKCACDCTSWAMVSAREHTCPSFVL